MNVFLLQSKSLTAFNEIPEFHPELLHLFFFPALPTHLLAYEQESVFLCKRNSHSKIVLNLEMHLASTILQPIKVQ